MTCEVTTLVANASPMLEQVPMGALPFGPQLARAVRERIAAGHLCLVCGDASVRAVISWPSDSGHPVPVWADLCEAHFSALDAERDRSE